MGFAVLEFGDDVYEVLDVLEGGCLIEAEGNLIFTDLPGVYLVSPEVLLEFISVCLNCNGIKELDRILAEPGNGKSKLLAKIGGEYLG